MDRSSFLALCGAGVVFVALMPSLLAEQADRFHYGAHNLIGASPEEVGRFAQEYVQAQHQVQGDTAQVLLSRPVTRADIPALGLGCPPDFAAIEEPPLMLVILKGDFTPNVPGSTVVALPAKYLAYIFDVWAAEPVSLWTAPDGAIFRTALNDPSLQLPPADWAAPRVCPTAAPKTLHYGDIAPTPPPPDDLK